MIENEYYTLISDYFCTDCDLSGDFKTVIQHRIQFHEHEKLIVHRKILLAKEFESTNIANLKC